MAFRAKHRRLNWIPERADRAFERAKKEAQRPTPQKRERQRRVLPVSVFLRGGRR